MFTDEELKRLATPLSIRLERAVEHRNEGEIQTIQELMNEECLVIHDSYLQWMGTLQTYILKNVGPRAHDEAMLWAGEYGLRPFTRQLAERSVKERVKDLCDLMLAKGSTFTVHEQKRRIRLKLEPWGPARQWIQPYDWQADEQRTRRNERLVYPAFGGYDQLYQSDTPGYEHPSTFWEVPGPKPVTHGKSNVPCSVVPEILMLEIYAIELYGAPLAVIQLPDDPEGTTYLDIYKNPADVPDEAYEKVDMARPKSTDLSSAEGTLFTEHELEQMTIPYSLRVEKALENEDWEAFDAISDRYDFKLVGAKDPMGIMIAGLLSWIARHLGEDATEESLQWTADIVMGPLFVDLVNTLNREEQMRLWAMVWRAHGSTFTMEETEDRFLFRGKPLGACHRMWSDAYQQEIERISDDKIRYPTFGCYTPPANFHRMREPRGITYGKTNYPVYSTHCHMLHEIYAIDRIGYPLWVEEHPDLEDRNEETVHIHYKDPADWPERYYDRVGRSKDEADLVTETV